MAADRRARIGKRRTGLTVAEMIVVMAIIAVLAAMMMPAMRGRSVHADAVALTNTLSGLRQGIQGYRLHTGWYPSSIFQLVAIPGQQNSPLTTSCGGALASATVQAAWRGPYISQQVGTGGIQTAGMAIAPDFTRDTVVVAGFTGDIVGSLRINVLGVTQTIAERVDGAFDGGSFSAASGAVTWADTGATPGVLVFRIPVSGC